MTQPLSISTSFPYTTLFRSLGEGPVTLAAGALLTPPGGELFEQVPLLLGERGRVVHVQEHADVPAAFPAQRRHPQCLQGAVVAGLGSGMHVYVPGGARWLHRERRD